MWCKSNQERLKALWAKMRNQTACFCVFCGRDGMALLKDIQPALYHCGACGSYMRIKDWTPKSDHVDAPKEGGDLKEPVLQRIRNRIQALFDELARMGDMLDPNSPAAVSIDAVLRHLADARAGIVLIDKALQQEETDAAV